MRQLRETKRVSTVPRLTGRGRAFIVVGLVLWAMSFPLGLPMLAWCATVLLVALAASFVGQWWARSMVDVERQISPVHVAAGESFAVTVVLSRSEQWRDVLPRAVIADAHGAGSRGTYRAVASRRGVHQVGPVMVTRRDPWGLVEVDQRVGHVTNVTVLPRLVPVNELGFEAGTAGDANRHTGSGQDDIIARPYVTGDEIKRLHWKATARRGELMVRQEEDREHPQLVVVMDHEAGVHGIDLDSDVTSRSLEWAISTAASLVHHHAAEGYEIHLVGLGHLDCAHDLEARLQLAQLDPVHDPDRRTLDPVNADTIIVVTGRVDLRSAEALATSIAGREVTVVATTSPDAAVEVFTRAGWHVEVSHPS